ncbi:MAG TPA: hypothetical protein VHT70_01940 [Candidatus Saccharimonadales bacterium]|jgi:hypothetical protein|nr:hypothetical protein [Candidatus Saccharimonadales bacterium]
MKESANNFEGFDRHAGIPRLDGGDLQSTIDSLHAAGYEMNGGMLIHDDAERTAGSALTDGELGAAGEDVIAGPYVLPGDNGEGTYFPNGVGRWVRPTEEIQEPQA